MDWYVDARGVVGLRACERHDVVSLVVVDLNCVHNVTICVVVVVVRGVIVRHGRQVLVLEALDLLEHLDGLHDVLDLHLVDVELGRAELEIGGGEQVQECAVAMPQHGEELDERYAREEDEEREAERLEAQRLVVEARYGHIDVVAHLVLHQLQVEDDHHPESVDHEEDKAAVVAQRLEVARHLGLVGFVLDERIEVACDHLLEEGRLARLHVVRLALG